MELTAIVVALGDDPRVQACLEALRRETGGIVELAVVENGAPDGPAPELPLAPAVRLRRSANPGFAGAVNEALAATHGELVLTLNPDAVLEPGALDAARERLASDPAIGAVAFRLERPDGRTLDSAGIRLGPVRRPRDRGMGSLKSGRHLEPAAVDAACMACALFRRRALESARDGAGEILDSRFFAYKEDVDLGWRMRRAGWKVAYEPTARAVHERGWKEGGRAGIPEELRILSLRNRWLTIAKNESAWSFVLRLALYVPYEVLAAVRLLLREPGVLRAYPRIVAELRETLRRRVLRPGER